MPRLGLLLGAAPCVHGSVYMYNQQLLQPNVIQYRRVGMWTPSESPYAGDGESSVEIDVEFARIRPAMPGLVQCLVFHSADLPLVGAEMSDGSRVFCCTPELFARDTPGCESVGRMITRTSADGGYVAVHDVAFDVNGSTSSLSASVPIVQSGVHYLLMSSCEPATGEVLISGQTSWHNPYGFLPGELFPFLPFFGFVCFAYVVVGVVWLLLCLRYASLLLPLQSYIGGVILLGIIESATWYLDYRAFNSGGSRGVAPVVVGVLISTVKKTVSRLLVLAVCLGYGVVRPTLGSTAYKVLTLGVVYFVFSAVLDVASNVSQISEVSPPLRLAFILPVAVLDAVFYWWLFSGLARTLSQLSSRRQSAKLQLYRRFSYILLASIALSGVWVTWQIAVIVSDTLDARWASLWMFDAFWHLLYLCILLATCYLWSPNKNNLQYAYMDEIGQEEEEEEEA